MNRQFYWSIPALIISILVFSTVTFLTNCSSSSGSNNHLTPPPVVLITATSGGGQSAVVSAPFTNPLTATVTTGGTPTSGVSVTFTSPASTDGTFADGGTPGVTDTETTNTSGVATSTVFTAGTTAGTYTVTGSAPGATATASFSLTNTAGPATNLIATSGGGQSAVVSAAFANPLVATVTDGDGNAVTGVSVTFTAPASGASGLFADGGTPAATDTVMTDANGKATSTTFTANATPGGPYNVVASSTGLTSVNFALTNVAPPLAAGNYVYYVSGEDNDGGYPGPYFVAGVFTLDGSGAVTGGEQSFDDNIVYEQDNISSSGSGVVTGNNGNVLITLTTCNGIDCTTTDSNIGVAGVETFDASMVSSTNGLLTEYDAWASGSGTLELQTSMAAPSGGYAFFVGGVDYLGGALVIGGVVNVDNVGGAGNISGAGSVFDESDAGVLSPDQLFAASTVTGPDAFGQVVFTLNPLTSDDLTVFEFTMVGYVVDADHIRWVENQFLDATGGNTGGVALSQGSKTGTYSSADIAGSNGVFGTVGGDANGPLQTAGLLTFNADGSISGNVSFNDFTFFTPQGGATLAAEGATLCSSGTAPTPCYTIDASGTGNDGGTGRISITNVTDSTAAPTFNYNLQLYLAHSGAVVISMDASDWSAGLGYAQTGAGSFSAGSFSGSYALNVDQQDTASTTGFEYDGIGTVMADGTSSLTGFLDLNGILGTPLTPTPGTAGGVTGTFTANANGVFTGTITGIDTVSATTADKFTFYLIGAPSGASVGVIGIENDDEQLTLGTFELQQ